LQQNDETVVAVRGDFRHGADESLGLRPAEFDRLFRVLVDDELERPSEA
jgi:hypothetical protein